ncbi:hypothetical protein T09_2886 [Trichinella sp. T9]|nr:hypothetical protein T09_2886 [Trichinella sp. T9]
MIVLQIDELARKLSNCTCKNGTTSLSQNYDRITTYVKQSSPAAAYNETLLHECKTKRYHK